MAEKVNRLSCAGSIDDRKRARERTSVDGLKGASPKKGKKDATAFSFPTFETELDEIEQRCLKGAEMRIQLLLLVSYIQLLLLISYVHNRNLSNGHM